MLANATKFPRKSGITYRRGLRFPVTSKALIRALKFTRPYGTRPRDGFSTQTGETGRPGDQTYSPHSEDHTVPPVSWDKKIVLHRTELIGATEIG